MLRALGRVALTPHRTSQVGSLNKGTTNLLPRTEIPMSATNQLTLLGEGELRRSFAEASRVGGERSLALRVLPGCSDLA